MQQKPPIIRMAIRSQIVEWNLIIFVPWAWKFITLPEGIKEKKVLQNFVIEKLLYVHLSGSRYFSFLEPSVRQYQFFDWYFVCLLLKLLLLNSISGLFVELYKTRWNAPNKFCYTVLEHASSALFNEKCLLHIMVNKYKNRFEDIFLVFQF